jgi:hypothetical protein
MSPRALGSSHRALDDQELIEHGDDATSIAIPESATLALGQVAAVAVSAAGAFGKSIIVPVGDLKWTQTVVGIIDAKVTKAGTELHALRQGATSLTITDGVTSTAATVSITVAPPASVSWQTAATHPNVDGAFSTRGNMSFISYAHLLGQAEFELTAAADLHHPGAEKVKLSIDIAPYSGGFELPGTYNDQLADILLISLGSDVWEAGSVDFTTYDVNTNYVAGTFEAGPNDPSGQLGSIIGSFSGIVESVIRPLPHS